MLETVVPFVHRILRDKVKKTDYTIDATCGNGHDTLFLANLSKHVYAFDIQKAAIANTTKLLEENNHTNYSLFEESHISFSSFISTEVTAITYNLGYLPGSDKTIKTNPSTTIESIKNGLSLLKRKGIISIILYIGHDGGLEEANTVEDFAVNLDGKEYSVIKYQFINRYNSPYVIIIEKL